MTVPQMLGDRYLLGEILGRGGMAEVRRARDTRLGRDVAIKQLRVDLAGDPVFQARFRREAQSAAGLNHPNIVSVYDTGVSLDPGTHVEIPYIVMEIVEGQTLRDVLRDGRRIQPERALELTIGVLDALAYSHRSGIIHRDIKPANVMLTQTGQVKVMDFGIARAVSDTQATMTQTAAVIGTAAYLSPEQARGETVDARSDVYSAGCLLYELLTSRAPFIGDSPVAVAYQHVRETPLAPSYVDNDPLITPEMDAVVLKSLAKDPVDRYQSARDMRDDIARVLTGEPILGQIPRSFLAGGQSTQVMSATTVLPGSMGSANTSEMGAVVSRGYDDPDGPRNPAIKWLIGIMIVAIIGALGFATYAFVFADKDKQPTPTETSPTVVLIDMPDVKNKTKEEATSQLTRLGLEVTVEEIRGTDADKGKVVSTTPEAGAKLQPKQKVTIRVSTGPADKGVPNVTGKSLDEAKSILEAAGFRVVAETADSEPAAAKTNEVVSQDPLGGNAAPGTTVVLKLATGRARVPNVHGMTEDAARQSLADAGFTDVSVVRRPSSEQTGTVFEQDPPRDSLKQKTTKITITVADAMKTPTQTATPRPSRPTITVGPPSATTSETP